jgi:hypothetical protein
VPHTSASGKILTNIRSYPVQTESILYPYAQKDRFILYRMNEQVPESLANYMLFFQKSTNIDNNNNNSQ